MATHRDRVAGRHGIGARPGVGGGRRAGRRDRRRPVRAHPRSRPRAGLLPTLADVVTAADVVVERLPTGGGAAGDGRRDGGGGRARPLLADLNAVSPDTVTGAEQRARRGVRPGRRLDQRRTAAARAATRWSTCPGPGGRRGRPAGRRDPDARRRRPRRHGVGGEDVHGLGLQGHDRPLGAGAPDRVRPGCARGRARRPRRGAPEQLPDGRRIAMATSKAGRFVGEMEQIAATQHTAGALRRAVAGMAAVYDRLARPTWPRCRPRRPPPSPSLPPVLDRLSGSLIKAAALAARLWTPRGTGGTAAPGPASDRSACR